MRFTEINLFGVYVAPISVMMVAAWVITIELRRVGIYPGIEFLVSACCGMSGTPLCLCFPCT